MSLINDALKRAEKNMHPQRDPENRPFPKDVQRRWSVPRPRWTLIGIVCLMISAMAPTVWLLVAGSGSGSKAVASPAPPIILMSPDTAADDETQRLEATAELTLAPKEREKQEEASVVDEIPAETILIVPATNHRLSGIMHGPRGPSAIVNGRSLRVGQTIEGAKVLRINTRSVVLQTGDRQIILRL